MYLIIRRFGVNKDYFDTYTYKTYEQFDKYWLYHKEYAEKNQLRGYEEYGGGDLKFIRYN